MKMLKLAALVLGNVILVLSTGEALAFSDDFEFANHWAVGGRRVSWTPNDPGSWTWSHAEVASPDDGYLEMHVQGPLSGNSYGATPWIRTEYDFNDGNSYVHNFTWNVSVPSRWLRLLVQIVDGDNLPTFEEAHAWAEWLDFDAPGTKNLLWSPRGPGGALLPGLDFPDYAGSSEKMTWSITTDPLGVATLHDGPNGTGDLLCATTLDTSQPWHTRLMIFSGTSAGLPAGDGSFNLYSYSASAIPEPSTVMLLTAGCCALLAFRHRRVSTCPTI